MTVSRALRRVLAVALSGIVGASSTAHAVVLPVARVQAGFRGAPIGPVTASAGILTAPAVAPSAALALNAGLLRPAAVVEPAAAVPQERADRVQRAIDWLQRRLDRDAAPAGAAAPDQPDLFDGAIRVRPETLYKIIWKEQWEQIQATGGLIPQPQRGRGLAGMSGNWTVEARSLGAWTRPTKYFGSALQALLFGTMRSKRARGAAGKPVTDAVLLEIKVAPDDALLVRNLAPVFDRLDAAPYYASLKPLEAHVARAASRDIPEILIETPVPLERLRAVSVVAESRLPDWGVISRFRVDPARLLAGLRDPASGPLAVATSGKRVRFTGGLVVGLARYMLKPMESVLAWAILAPGAFAASFAVNLARAPRALAFSARLMPRHSAMPKAAKAFMFAVGFPVFAPLLGMVVNPMKESLQAVKAGHGAWREGGFRAGFAAAVAQVSRQNQVFLAKERFMTVALSTQREPVALRLALSAYLGALAWASASLALSWAWLAPVLLSAAVVEVFAAAFVLAASDKG